MKKMLNLFLLISFVITIIVPITGVYIHKLASVVFFLLCMLHAVIYRKKLNRKKCLLLALILISFVSGALGMVFDQMVIHRVVSIVVVFFLAIHIFVFHKKLQRRRESL